jgi:2-phospho-L-lactate guanylyltransferase
MTREMDYRRLDGRRGARVLVAIKSRAHCKTRLAQTLAPAARLQLVRSMLATVLSAAQAAQTVRQVIVVSPERDTVAAEVPVLADTGRSLNDALTQAHRVLREFGCRELVVLPADLPLISAADIDALVRAGRSGGFALAPDTAGTGTNALCLAAAQPFHFQFGVNSRELHLDEAMHTGLRAQVVNLPGLEFDVDSPADLSRLDGHPWRARLPA